MFYNLFQQGFHHTKFNSIWTAFWTDRKDLFSKIAIEKFSNFRLKLYLFCRRAIENICFPYRLPTQGIFHTKTGLVWTTFCPMEKTNFIFSKIRKFLYGKQFFSRQAIAQNLFFLPFNYTGDTTPLVGFNFNNHFTQLKIPIFFLNFLFQKFSTFPIKTYLLNFFQGKLYKTSFFAHSKYTG